MRREGDTDKNVRTLEGGSQKRTRAYKGGRGGKKVTILSVRTFWMAPKRWHLHYFMYFKVECDINGVDISMNILH